MIFIRDSSAAFTATTGRCRLVVIDLVVVGVNDCLDPVLTIHGDAARAAHRGTEERHVITNLTTMIGVQHTYPRLTCECGERAGWQRTLSPQWRDVVPVVAFLDVQLGIGGHHHPALEIK